MNSASFEKEIENWFVTFGVRGGGIKWKNDQPGLTCTGALLVTMPRRQYETCAIRVVQKTPTLEIESRSSGFPWFQTC